MGNGVTVVTPTYNRATHLQTLYRSLCSQTVGGFTWLIIDDGSTDNTTDVVNGMKSDIFNIEYQRKENGGKHTALNLAIDIVETELFFIVDSDDTLTNNAIETIEEDWRKVKGKDLCGISYLRGYSQEVPIGDIFPKDKLIDSFADVRVNKKVYGDKAEVWATKYLKRYRFPVYKGEKFLVESYLWLQISKIADMLFINKIIYLTEYLEGGLTKSGRRLRIKCPKGGMAFNLILMDKTYPMRDRIKSGILYSVYSFFSHKDFKETYDIPYKALFLICYPIGYLVYLYWNYKYNK